MRAAARNAVIFFAASLPFVTVHNTRYCNLMIHRPYLEVSSALFWFVPGVLPPPVLEERQPVTAYHHGFIGCFGGILISHRHDFRYTSVLVCNKVYWSCTDNNQWPVDPICWSGYCWYKYSCSVSSAQTHCLYTHPAVKSPLYWGNCTVIPGRCCIFHASPVNFTSFLMLEVGFSSTPSLLPKGIVDIVFLHDTAYLYLSQLHWLRCSWIIVKYPVLSRGFFGVKHIILTFSAATMVP